MKKVLSVFFAVLFVLSVMTVAASAWETSCPYCGEKFTSEIEYTEHMKLYNFTDGHYVTCPYTGDDYKDGGCGEKFATKEAYDIHVANCKHNGDYSAQGYAKYVLGKVWDSIKGVDWGSLFSSLVAIVKALVAGIPFGDIVSTVKGLF
ncbi:MAG: hypothetical protein IJM02_07070 [Clostridia bacterium]|nr:hypothetical protein [Clostridia bacterium]